MTYSILKVATRLESTLRDADLLHICYKKFGAERRSVAGVKDSLDTILREMIREVVREEVRAALDEFAEAEKATAAASSENSTYLTADEASEIAGVSAQTVRTWISKGELRGCRAGRLLRIKRSDLDAYLERPEVAKVPSWDQDEARVQEILASIQTD